MSAPESVTHWIQRAQAGDERAPQKLWEFYFQRLVALARKKLRSKPLRAADEEDVALSIMDSMFRGLGAGRFPQLDDRDNLWRLLVVITARKVVNRQVHEHRLKRAAGVAARSCSGMPQDWARLQSGQCADA